MYSSSQVDLSESRQGSLYAADTVTYVFALTAVGLRFWSRRIKKIGFWLDDWLVLAALVCVVSYEIFSSKPANSLI